MKEIRWHGRGGNGAFTVAKLLGYAVSLHEGKFAQAFPSFGPERRGAPVLGFTRISDIPFTDHSQVYSCDCIIVLDETLCAQVDVTAGIKDDGTLLMNTTRPIEEVRQMAGFDKVHNLIVFDATKLALEELGAPIVNTTMLGAAAAIADLAGLDALLEAVDGMMAKNLRAKNKNAITRAYNMMKEV